LHRGDGGRFEWLDKDAPCDLGCGEQGGAGGRARDDEAAACLFLKAWVAAFIALPRIGAGDIGDIAGGLLAGYGLMIAARLRAPAPILLRMLLNIAIDTIGGVIPLVGDLFDTQFRANTRNLALLERWLEDPHGSRRQGVLLLLGVAVAFCALLTLTVWLAVRVIAWIFSVPG